jgi:membrane fusion protein (multidrug efflux system)
VASQFSRTTRSLTTDTAKYAIVTWLLAAVLLAGWMTWFFFGTVNVYEMSRKARVEVQQAAHSIEASIQGRIVATSLAIGQEVKAGDVLVELDASSEKLRLQEEEARLRVIPPRMASLQKEIAFREQSGTKDQLAARAATETARYRSKEAQAAVEFAKDNARRLKDESTAGGVAQIEAARAQNEAQKLSASNDASASEVRRLESDAQTRVSQNQAQIQNLRSALVSLEGDMTTIRATIARLKQDIDKHFVRAPVSGRIGDASPLRVGANVTPGQKLAAVVPGGALMIVAEFSPAVLGRIKPGQPARLRLDGFPWAQFGSIDAKVSRVAGEIREGQARIEFAVAPVSIANKVLQHGLPGSIEVTVDHASPAVMILRAAGQMLSTSPQQAQMQPMAPLASPAAP